jgi:hypothetical protein
VSSITHSGSKTGHAACADAAPVATIAMVDITTKVERPIHFTVSPPRVDLLRWEPASLTAFLSVSLFYRLQDAWNPIAIGVHLLSSPNRIGDPSQ